MPSCSASVSMTRPAMESCTWKMPVTFSSNRPLQSVCPSLTRSSRDVTLRRSPSFWSVPSSTADTPSVRPISIGSSSARVCFATLLSGLTAISGSSLSCAMSASAIPSWSAGLLCSATIARNGSTATEVISPPTLLAGRSCHHDRCRAQRHQALRRSATASLRVRAAVQALRDGSLTGASMASRAVTLATNR